MFIFGHTGITSAIIRVYEKSKYGTNYFHKKIDYRIVALCSIAPDLIDKPLGLLYPTLVGNRTRLAAHTWFSCVIVLGLGFFYRKRGNSLLYSVSFMLHMLGDRMWKIQDLPVFLFPFLGTPKIFEQHAMERWKNIAQDTYTMSAELIGIVCLIWLIYDLFKSKCPDDISLR